MAVATTNTSPTQRVGILLQSTREKMPRFLHSLRSSRTLWPVINILSLIVWIFSMAGTFHCTFIMISFLELEDEEQQGAAEVYSTIPLASYQNNNTVTDLSGTGSSSTAGWVDHPVGVGLFSTSVYDMDANLLGCVSYYGTGNNEFDGAFRAARAFGMIGALSTTLGLIFVSLVTLFITEKHVEIKENLWGMARFLFFAAFVCQLLTFLAFGRKTCSRIDRDCSPGPAAILSVMNLFLLCIQSALIYVVPPVNTPLFVLQKEKPMSIIDIGSAGFEINDHNQNQNHNHTNQPATTSPAALEILSIEKSSSSLSSQRQNEQQGNESDNLEDIVDGSDLESEHNSDSNNSISNPHQPMNNHVVMEGIECVEADHKRRRNPKTKSNWQAFEEHYRELGRRKSTRITLGFMLCLSWIFTLVGTFRCTFLLVGARGQNSLEFSGLGLFNRAYYMNDDLLGCIAYSEAAKDGFDSPFGVGRTFAIFTVLFMTASFWSYFILHGLFEPSRNKEIVWTVLTQITLPCALLSQLLVFSAFKTESCTNSDSVNCIPGVAGIVAILNVFLLFPLAIFIFAIPSPRRPFFRLRAPLPLLPPGTNDINLWMREHKEQRQQQQQIQHIGEDFDFDDNVRVRNFIPEAPEGVEVCNMSTEEQDGKRTTRKEIKHADGSTTITTVVEEDLKPFNATHREGVSDHFEGTEATDAAAAASDDSDRDGSVSEGSYTEDCLCSDDGSTFNTGDGAINYDPSVAVDNNGKVVIQ